MKIEIKEVNSDVLLQNFIYLPEQIHKHYQLYVPPFYKDEVDFHDPEKNKNLILSDTVKFLSFRGNEITGRIMGIIYHPWILKENKKWARFYQFDCRNDKESAEALLSAVENWARQKGMSEIIGSFGFSDKDPQGIQVQGFEYPPVIASVSHQPYLSELVANFGYVKFKDCVSYKINIPETTPQVYTKIYSRLLKNRELKLLEFHNRKSLKPYFGAVLKLMNEGYKDIFGFVPMSDEDITNLAKQYLSVLDPALVKLITNSYGEPVAFVIAMANISKGIRKAKGKLFPLGFIRILMEMKRSKQLDLLLGAVANAYRGRGLTALLGIALMESARHKGLVVMDSHLVLEENRLMRAELENLGGELHKRYRIFKKSL